VYEKVGGFGATLKLNRLEQRMAVAELLNLQFTAQRKAAWKQ